MMRILFLNYEYPPLGGGAGNATEYLMREFGKDETIEVDCVVSAVDNTYSEEALSKNVRLYRLPIGDKRNSLKGQSAKELLTYAWRALVLCKKLARERKYDVVHAFFTVPCGVVAWRLWKQFHIPYIVSLRGSDVPGYSKKYEKLYFFIQPLVKEVWKRSAGVVSNSEGLKKLALKTNSEQEIGVIYNGVDTNAFTPKGLILPPPLSADGHLPLRQGETIEKGILIPPPLLATASGHLPSPRRTGEEGGEKTFSILCASRLEARKGFRYVISAVDALRERYPQVRLVIAGGDGNAGEELRAQVAEKKLSDVVTFSGQYTREDLVRLQQVSDVFVLPSFNEGMSNSLLEAMAGGLPVIMTPTGGAEELIRDGENGYIVPSADSEKIAEKLEILLTDAERTKNMGRESRRIAELMSWGAVAKEYRELYDAKRVTRNV